MSTIDKVKNALHLNKDHSTTTGTTTGTTHTHNTHTSGTAEGVAGPHNNRVANAADPRVDSDRDGSRTTGTGTGYGNTSATTHTSGTAEGVAGPHNSRIANAADPRVDSDLDGSRNAGYGNTSTTGYNSNTTGTGVTGTTGTGYSGSTNAGPHSSNIANKLDPRVDSDRDGSTNLGARSGNTGYSGTHTGNTVGGTTHTGFTGGVSNSTNAGPHDSNLANKVDPRVDSDLDGRGNRHGAATGGILGASGSHATPGSGTAQNTAGPHNSDILNKLDPRVDSDRDGSQTYGGNRTHADTTSHIDAARMPPSVFAAHKGEPKILHGDHKHDHAGRHGSVVSNQEQLSGV